MLHLLTTFKFLSDQQNQDFIIAVYAVWSFYEKNQWKALVLEEHRLTF